MICEQFDRFENLQFLDFSQLKFADRYIEMKMKNYSEKFEYYYDMHLFAMKCFDVLKKGNRRCVIIGLALCKGEVVDFLLDDKHKDCKCSSVLFKTKLN